MSDEMTVMGYDGIRRSFCFSHFGEHYGTIKDVEQDPTGAMWAIHKQAYRIEELEAKLAKAVKALEFIDDTISWEINPSNYGHDEVCDMNRDWGEMGNYVEAALAEMNGETDD